MRWFQKMWWQPLKVNDRMRKQPKVLFGFLFKFFFLIIFIRLVYFYTDWWCLQYLATIIYENLHDHLIIIILSNGMNPFYSPCTWAKLTVHTSLQATIFNNLRDGIKFINNIQQNWANSQEQTHNKKNRELFQVLGQYTVFPWWFWGNKVRHQKW